MPTDGPITITWIDLALCSSLLLANGAVSMWLGLGLGRKLLIAGLRTVVQLSLLGLVLVHVFEAGNVWLVVVMGTLMILMASYEAVKRAGRRYRGVHRDVFTSLLLSASASMLFVSLLVLQTDPWWAPRYLIPLLGMVLGNSLTGVSIGLERCLSSFDEDRPAIELWIAAGAHPWEAARPTAARSLRSGLIPILNAMSVAGMVTIPGMMTGQILGGTEPGMAARYQILVMFLIAGATAAGTTGVVLLAVRAMFDEGGRIKRSVS
jgi:putative ABC transport system permease protein